MKENTMEVNGYQQLFGLPSFFKTLLLVFKRRKKEQLEGEEMMTFHFFGELSLLETTELKLN